MKTCTCIEDVNAKLAQRNTRLSLALVFSDPVGERLMITTEVIEKKRGAKACVMFPSFCPFCGEKYQAGAS